MGSSCSGVAGADNDIGFDIGQMQFMDDERRTAERGEKGEGEKSRGGEEKKKRGGRGGGEFQAKSQRTQ
jgi:hypothetical protein